MSPLRIATSECDMGTLISLSGSADMAEMAQLRRQVEVLLDRGQYDLVMDLSELNFACSMALGVLIQVHKCCRAQGGRFVLVGPQAGILKVLRTTKLDHLFELYGNLNAAISARQEGRTE